MLCKSNSTIPNVTLDAEGRTTNSTLTYLEAHHWTNGVPYLHHSQTLQTTTIQA
jgi:hypothetical protein